MFGSSRNAIQATRNRSDKVRDMFGDDFFRRGDLLASEPKRLICHRLQRIDVIKINAFHFIYVGIDITRDSNVDDEKRTIDTIA